MKEYISLSCLERIIIIMAQGLSDLPTLSCDHHRLLCTILYRRPLTKFSSLLGLSFSFFSLTGPRFSLSFALYIFQFIFVSFSLLSSTLYFSFSVSLFRVRSFSLFFLSCFFHSFLFFFLLAFFFFFSFLCFYFFFALSNV